VPCFREFRTQNITGRKADDVVSMRVGHIDRSLDPHAELNRSVWRGLLNSIALVFIPRDLPRFFFGQGWAGKSLENVGKSLIFGCDLRKLCEE